MLERDGAPQRRRTERMASSRASPPRGHMMLTLTQEFANSQLPPLQPQDFQHPPVNSALRYVPDQVGFYLLIERPSPPAT